MRLKESDYTLTIYISVDVCDKQIQLNCTHILEQPVHEIVRIKYTKTLFYALVVVLKKWVQMKENCRKK
jgi:hypothetical protein